MKKFALAGLVVGTMLAFAPAAYAASDPSGVLCGFTSLTDPTIEGSQTGEIDGGPLVFTDDTDPATTYTGTLHCTIQTGSNDTHAEADAASCNSGAPAAVAVVACTTTYAVGEDEPVYLCSHVTGGTTPTLYWDDTAGAWTTNSSAPCSLAISAAAPGGGRPVVHPSGSITISGNPVLGVTIAYGAFSPPREAFWSCSESYNQVQPSATCMPLDPPRPAVNRCGTLAVEVSNTSPTWVEGESRCSTGAMARAGSNGLTGPGASSAIANGSFAWTCSAYDVALSVYTMTCTVGSGTEASEPGGDEGLISAIIGVGLGPVGVG